MTDREKALAAAREIKSGIQPELLQVSRFSVKATADIILKHMQPDRELVEALRKLVEVLETVTVMDDNVMYFNGRYCGELQQPLAEAESVLSKWEREK